MKKDLALHLCPSFTQKKMRQHGSAVYSVSWFQTQVECKCVSDSRASLPLWSPEYLKAHLNIASSRSVTEAAFRHALMSAHFPELFPDRLYMSLQMSLQTLLRIFTDKGVSCRPPCKIEPRGNTAGKSNKNCKQKHCSQQWTCRHVLPPARSTAEVKPCFTATQIIVPRRTCKNQRIHWGVINTISETSYCGGGCSITEANSRGAGESSVLLWWPTCSDMLQLSMKVIWCVDFGAAIAPANERYRFRRQL